MNAKRKIRRALVTMLSVALLAACTLMPAMAASVTGDGTNAVTGFTITKNLTKEANTMVPNVSFGYTVAPANPTASEERNGVPVSRGIDGGVTCTDTAVFAPGGALNNSTTVSDTVDFDIVATSFTTPGVYKYTITENAFDYDGITDVTGSLTLYVYVENVNNKVQVTYTEVVDPDGGTGSTAVKTDTYTNDYDSQGNVLHDLTVYKVISGNAADLTDSFSFDVTISGETGEQYYVQIGTYTAEGGFAAGSDAVILTSGTKHTFTLGNNQAIKIYGLDSDDSYTVEELNDNTNGYTLKINDVSNADGITSGTISADATVKFENNKVVSTPTGVILNVAPYALMVVIAAVGALVFLRKRAED